MRFVWTPDLSIGVESIDVQHQELFQQVNALLVALAASARTRRSWAPSPSWRPTSCATSRTRSG